MRLALRMRPEARVKLAVLCVQFQLKLSLKLASIKFYKEISSEVRMFLAGKQTNRHGDGNRSILATFRK